jgi:hypothetical protein
MQKRSSVTGGHELKIAKYAVLLLVAVLRYLYRKNVQFRRGIY